MPQKKKVKKLVSKEKKGRFFEIDLHGKILQKCRSGVGGGDVGK